MNKTLFSLVVAGCMAAVSTSYASDLTGKLGLNYTVGPSFVIGGEGANDASRVGPQVGAGLEYGLARTVAATFAYDDLEDGFQSQAITFGATFRPMPQNSLSPFFNAGMGIGHRYSGDGWDHFALKLTGGVEHFFTDNLSLAGLFSYYYIPGANNVGIGDVHVFEPGVRLSFYFWPSK